MPVTLLINAIVRRCSTFVYFVFFTWLHSWIDITLLGPWTRSVKIINHQCPGTTNSIHWIGEYLGAEQPFENGRQNNCKLWIHFGEDPKVGVGGQHKANKR